MGISIKKCRSPVEEVYNLLWPTPLEFQLKENTETAWIQCNLWSSPLEFWISFFKHYPCGILLIFDGFLYTFVTMHPWKGKRLPQQGVGVLFFWKSLIQIKLKIHCNYQFMLRAIYCEKRLQSHKKSKDKKEDKNQLLEIKIRSRGSNKIIISTSQP